MARRHAPKRTSRRRLARLCAGLALAAGLVVVAGAARVALLVAAGVLCLAVVRWPRWEARLFGPRPTGAVLVRPEVWAGPVRPPAGGVGLGTEVHRAYAQALHAVTGAYLAECEREAQR